MTTAKVLETQGYSLTDLRWQLSRGRGRKVPERTLRWWLQELCIEPNEFGLYAVTDLQVLTRLVLFLRRCRSIAKFKTLLIQELDPHAD